MPLSGQVTLSGWPAKPRRGMAMAMKSTLIGGALAWHRRFLPMHFRSGAASKYGYKRRSKRYITRKVKKVGTAAPLYFTGLLRRQVRRTPRQSGTAKRGRIAMTVPWYAGLKIRTRNAPDIRAEILKIVRSEENRLVRAMETKLAEALNRVRGKRSS